MIQIYGTRELVDSRLHAKAILYQQDGIIPKSYGSEKEHSYSRAPDPWLRLRFSEVTSILHIYLCNGLFSLRSMYLHGGSVSGKP